MYPSARKTAAVKALEDLLDDRTDTSGILDRLDRSGPRRGHFYRPVKRQFFTLPWHVKRCE
jgi:hypothetical protein